jgi:HD-GYP domain-containing protein (c-di-GMP phosphodiesterase class II)
MPGSSDKIDRTTMELVLLHDSIRWLQTQELALRRAGYGQINAFPAHPQTLAAHLNSVVGRHTDIVVYGLLPGSETSWEYLRYVRGLYSGPLLATTENFDPQVRTRTVELGISDYLAVSTSDEEALDLKIETTLTAHRINSLVLENELRSQRLFVNILKVMIKILENKDPYTKFHSNSVAKWSRMIGRRVGLCDEDLDGLGLAAVFHDFGKIGIPEEILCKGSKLTKEEMDVMKKHPIIARDLLSSLELVANYLPAITHHHERWDGTGYPDGLKGEQAPLWARIIALADAYDTMASRRAYKEAFSTARIASELEKGKGTQFDPVLVEHLLAILKEHGAKAGEE